MQEGIGGGGPDEGGGSGWPGEGGGGCWVVAGDAALLRVVRQGGGGGRLGEGCGGLWPVTWPSCVWCERAEMVVGIHKPRT